MSDNLLPALKNTRKPEVTRTISPSPTTHITRASTADNTRRTVSWSGPTESLFGCRVEDIDKTEEWWLDHIHPDDRLNISRSLTEHLKPVHGNPHASESRIWGCDYRFRHAKGHYILVSDRSIISRDETGNVVKVTSVVSDKEKRSIERNEYEELHNSQNHLAAIADNTPSGIFMMDPQGYTTYMNTAGE